MDYFGPLLVKEGYKIWVALFTCLCTRAIHLEVSNNLSAENFIDMLRRFIARRGKPQTLISDNGKQFTLAQKIVDPKCQKNPLNSSAYADFLAKNGISWSFITERAPWKGGFYERLIGLVKHHIRRILAKSALSESKILTILCEVEFIVNCRPISFVSDSRVTAQPIRPIDFLSPHVNTNLLVPLTSSLGSQITRSNKEQLILSLEHGQNKLQEFWKRWSKDYLLALRERFNKTYKSGCKRMPKNGDVVLVYEENIPKGLWKLAIITNNKSLDKNSRSVIIRFPSGHVTKRAVEHLFPLESE